MSEVVHIPRWLYDLSDGRARLWLDELIEEGHVEVHPWEPEDDQQRRWDGQQAGEWG